MKGITPVISLILLIVIVITLVGFSFVYLQSVISSGGEAAQQSAEKEKTRLTSCLRIDGISENRVWVRNCGNSELSNFAVYIDDIPLSIISSQNIQPSSIGYVEVDFSESGLPSGTHNVKVTTSTAFDETVQEMEIISGMPRVTLNAPDNEALFTPSELVLFSCDADDDVQIARLELYFYLNNNWESQYNATSLGQHVDLDYSTNVPADEGTYNWKCEAVDNEDNLVAEQRSFTVQTLLEFTLGEMLGSVTTTTAKINVINRFEQPVDLKIEYWHEGETHQQTPEQLDIESSKTAEFALTGLSDADWKYKTLYRLGSVYLSGPTRTFHTQRQNNEDFNFTVFSDSHITQNYNILQRCKNVMSAINKTNTDISFALGDNTWIGITDIEPYYLNFRNCADIAHNSIPFYFVVGNHEGENGWSFSPLALENRTIFIPNPDDTTYPQGGSVNEDYYAFKWGNALFVVINVQSYTLINHELGSTEGTPYDWTLGSQQLTWLTNVLQSSTEKWKFIFVHHTVGGNANDASNTNYGRGGGRAAFVGEQEIIHNLMKQNNVNVFFHGHDHIFFDMTVDGVHYTQAGRSGYASGFNASYVNMNMPLWSSNQGYSFVQVKSNRVVVDFVTNESIVLNSYTINEDNGDTTAPVFVNYQPIAESYYNENLEIRANITDETDLNEEALYLYYRRPGDLAHNFSIVRLNHVGADEYNTTINRSYVNAGNIEYFIHAEDTNGNSINTNYYNVTTVYRKAFLGNDNENDYIIYDTCIRKTNLAENYRDCEAELGMTLQLFTGYNATYTYRSYIDFDTTIIPDNAQIVQVNISLYSPTFHGPAPGTVEYRNLSSLGSGYTNKQYLYANISIGALYANQLMNAVTRYNTTLGAAAAADLKSRLGANWFSVAIKESTEARNATIRSENTGAVSTRPVLVVSYYVP